MNFYLINSEAILNNKKVDHSSKIFWVSNEKEKEELSGAFKNLGKNKVAKLVQNHQNREAQNQLGGFNQYHHLFTVFLIYQPFLLRACGLQHRWLYRHQGRAFE